MKEKRKRSDLLKRLLCWPLLMVMLAGSPLSAKAFHEEDSLKSSKILSFTREPFSGSLQEGPEGQYPKKLIPMGRTLGIKIFSEGVIIVGIKEIETPEGVRSPGEEAGFKIGDVLTHIDGQKVSTIEDFTARVEESKGRDLKLKLKRNDRDMELIISPAETEEGLYRLGLWIRDSMAGIGTMTYYDPASGTFGALGHGVSDVDTGRLVPLSRGAVIESTVIGVKKGEAGAPGELQGEFNLSEDMGTVFSNTDCGIFGRIDAARLELDEPIEVAARKDVRAGKATILSNIDGTKTLEYDIEIIKVYPSALGSQRGMMIEVTDSRLLEKTGGIVQGMSGSPIIQGGKLIGAVTHVLVNDPARGYGIFIGNMLKDNFENLEGLEAEAS